MITQATTANLDPGHSREVLDAAYRQVFGNMHLMELDVLPSVDALFMNGDLTVQGLITALAQSETAACSGIAALLLRLDPGAGLPAPQNKALRAARQLSQQTP